MGCPCAEHNVYPVKLVLREFFFSFEQQISRMLVYTGSYYDSSFRIRYTRMVLLIVLGKPRLSSQKNLCMVPCGFLLLWRSSFGSSRFFLRLPKMSFLCLNTLGFRFDRRVSCVCFSFLCFSLSESSISQTKFYHNILLTLNATSKLHCCIYFENLLFYYRIIIIRGKKPSKLS